MYDMSQWKSQEQKKKESLKIHIEKKPLFEKFNGYAGGYGVHDKDKKARHKDERRKGKKICKDY